MESRSNKPVRGSTALPIRHARDKCIVRYLPFLILAGSVELATNFPYSSDLVGIILAMIAGGMAQWRRASDETLTVKQVVAEWVICGMGGFMVHAVLLMHMQNVRLIWTGCIAIGLTGSAGTAWFAGKVRARIE